MTDRVILLVTSPRLPAGLLTAQAWDCVRTHQVFAAVDSELVTSVQHAGGNVTVGELTADELLAAVAEHGTVVWLAGSAGDEELARHLGLRLAREPGRAELELLYGSWDPPGARLLDVVRVMDRLRSPGGCPWDAEQTHRSLAPYLLEEAYEAHDAIEAGDLVSLREEMGDVLLQVAFHSRLAEEEPDERRRWSIDDLAGELVAKLVRRHPHVFASVRVNGSEEVHANWEQIKRAEKARTSSMDGIVLGQPALALAAKVLSRARRAGVEVTEPAVTEAVPAEAVDAAAGADAQVRALGDQLFAIVADAQARGLDAEAALRRAALDFANAVRRAESG